jgi:hypothetical protein
MCFSVETNVLLQLTLVAAIPPGSYVKLALVLPGEILPSPSLLRGPSASSLLSQILQYPPSSLVAAGPPRNARGRSGSTR